MGTISESKQNSRGLESSSITLFPSTTPDHEGVFKQSLLGAWVSKIGRISTNNNRMRYDNSDQSFFSFIALAAVKIFLGLIIG
jgi:hypothetical protein